MLWPRVEGEHETWPELAPTLEPLLAEQVGRLFCPWTLANEAALAEGREELRVELAGEPWVQKPQKYHAKSLRALREKYASVPEADRDTLDPILERTGCLDAVRG
jgi:hypothetical protein